MVPYARNNRLFSVQRLAPPYLSAGRRIVVGYGLGSCNDYGVIASVMFVGISDCTVNVVDVSFGPERSDKPRTAAASLPRPVLLQIILAGLETSTTNVDNDAY